MATLERYGYWSSVATGTVWLLEQYGYWSCMATGAVWLLEQISPNYKKIALNLLGRPQLRNWLYRPSASLLGKYVFSFEQIP